MSIRLTTGDRIQMSSADLPHAYNRLAFTDLCGILVLGHDEYSHREGIFLENRNWGCKKLLDGGRGLPSPFLFPFHPYSFAALLFPFLLSFPSPPLPLEV